MEITGVSHITFIVRNLDAMSKFLCEGLGAEQVYDSSKKNFSISKERFYVVGGIWVAAMEGEPPKDRSYRHLAFQISEDELPIVESRLRSIGAEIKLPRPRVEGEVQLLGDTLQSLHLQFLSVRLKTEMDFKRFNQL